MRTVKTLFSVCIVHSSGFAANPSANDTDVSKIIPAAFKPSPLQENSRRLTDEIGRRVRATPAMQQAVPWGVQGFSAAGADSVHSKSFEIPNSWSQDATEMNATSAHRVSATGLGGGAVLSSGGRFQIDRLKASNLQSI